MRVSLYYRRLISTKKNINEYIKQQQQQQYLVSVFLFNLIFGLANSAKFQLRVVFNYLCVIQTHTYKYIHAYIVLIGICLNICYTTRRSAADTYVEINFSVIELINWLMTYRWLL